MKRRFNRVLQCTVFLFAVCLLPTQVSPQQMQGQQELSKSQKQLYAQLKTQTIPGQTAIIANAEKLLKPAMRPCENSAWAAVMEAMVAAATHELEMKQADLSVRASMGDKCFSSIANYEALNRFVAGEYAIGNGHHLRITATYAAGAPVSADAIIVALRAGQPMLMIWKGHPYMVYGLLFDELLQQTGDRLFEMREIRLLDPAKRADSTERKLTFVKGRDNPADIGGMITLKAEKY